MVGHGLPFAGVDQAVLFFQTADDPLHGLLEFRHPHLGLVPADGEERGLVDEVRQIRPHHARCHVGKGLQIEIGDRLDFLYVDPEDLLAPEFVRPIDEDVAVETARPEERRVKDLRPVRRGHEDHPDFRVEAVHLDQELVQRLLAFVVSAHGAETAGLPQGVELVDEDDAGGLLLGLDEEVPDAGRPEAYKHLDEFRSGEAEEGDAAFAGDGLGQEGLAGPRRSHKENPFGDPASDIGEFSRCFQEFDHLDQFLLRLVHPRHVREGDVKLVFHVDLRFVLA